MYETLSAKAAELGFDSKKLMRMKCAE
jgi:hypothetical protein